MSAATQLPLAHGDIIVTIHRWFWCGFQGSSDQLRSEGLLPPDVTLPEGRKEAQWGDTKWSFTLRRVRHPGSKALFAEWKSQDWWQLSRRALWADVLSNSDCCVVEKREEIERLLWSQSRMGKHQANLFINAKCDGAFQAFIAKAVGAA